MEEKKDMKDCCENCGTCENGSCGMAGAGQCGSRGWQKHCGGGHMGGRLLLGLVILAFVFWAGIKLGELKAQFSGWDKGYGMMGARSSRGSDYFNKPIRMMGGYYQGQTPVGQTQPAIPVE